jgi:hypothetical protein
MKRRGVVWSVLIVFAIIWLGMAAPVCADGDGTPTDPGDPFEVPPGCDTLDPTPGILSDFWMILMAMAFQLAL